MILRDWIRRWLADAIARGGDAKHAADGASSDVHGGAGDGANDDESALVGGDEPDPFEPFAEPVTLEITDVFDLHSIAPRDVNRAVEAYLEEARRAGFASVRIIHGKGRYVQREAVRKILSRTPFVRAFTDAPPQAGGLGATVAHLEKQR